ncbi:MtaA/CmuA family methyltransferase [Candidatus Hecatella orcuttiae]|jgi:[methyl-Co(III) methanol-specific corrinoid protein]:coenzyme M methyltransferase|uniref:MtaA/CmuA family methyltransferase n=1 Tax=Candidatus Hecatella orcuttiae TaxID=1935119 RepID=UPI002867F561|nr:MtaA/CmuA family methyltransferase [Candidatus Hecatella orcuttiae]
MKPYDRVMAVLQGRSGEADRIPCVNFTSTATLQFMEATGAWWPEAHREPEKMAKLGSAAHRLCGLDNVTVPFDMVVEAELLGAPPEFFEAEKAEGEVRQPSVKAFVVKEPSDLKIPSDVASAGRLPVVVKAVKILKEEFGGKTPVNVFMVPPFTCLCNYLVDTLTFLKTMVKEPEKIRSFLDASLDLFIQEARVYEEAGADVITLHEMGACCGVIAPSHFKDFVAPYLKKLVKSVKCPTVLNICGPTEKILPMMVECGANAVAIDETTPIKEARRIVDAAKPGYPIAGNISPKKILRDGTPEVIAGAVKTVIEEGVSIVSPGCDFFLDTPIGNIKTFVETVVKFGSGGGGLTINP